MALISVEALAARIGDPALRIVDTRWYLNQPGAGRAAYDARHIPGAVFLDLDDDLSDANGYGSPGRHPLPSPSDFRARMMRAGVGTSNLVVAYDDAGGTVAARLWWMLDNLGHRGGVAVLDGGLPAWVTEGQPMSTESSTPAPATELQLADEWTRIIDREALRDRLGSVVVLDARAAERYRGEIEPIDPAKGHIPTAVSFPAAANLGPDGRFLPTATLRDRFARATQAAPSVTYCGSGTTACHNVLAARIGGGPEPLLYVGSFSDWSRSGLPVATGNEPAGPSPTRVG